MDHHLDLEEMEHLLALHCDWDTAYEWTFHLFTCPPCRQRLLAAFPREAPPFLNRLFRRAHPQDCLSREPATGSAAPDLSELKRIGARLVKERASATAQVRELLDQPHELRVRRIRGEAGLSTLGLVLALLEEARRTWHDAPQGAKELAELAVEAADALDPERYERRLIHDLQGTAWAYLGNAQRILSDLRAAETAFDRAEASLRQGSEDPLDWALLLDLKSSLRRAQRRFQEALALLEVAGELYRAGGDHQGEIKVTLQMGCALGAAGQLEASVEVLAALAERTTIEEAGGELYGSLLHNLATSLAKAGRAEEARALLPEIRHLAEHLGGTLDRNRADWLEALVLEGLGEHDEAAARYGRVRDTFIAEGIGYDAALVSLDLAALCLQEGRWAEARQLAAEMRPIFLSRDVHQEAASALLVLADALKRQVATLDLVRDVSDYLRRARNRPDLSYGEPS